MTDVRCRVAWLYPRPKRASLMDYLAGNSPDQLSAITHMSEFGIDVDLWDPSEFPLNPLAARHSLYSGLDPVRTLRLLVAQKKYDLVVSVGEASAAIYLGIAPLNRRRIPVVVWDPGLTFGWRMRARVLDFVLPRADGVFVVGTNQKHRLEARYRDRVRAEVALHWIDTDFYKPLHGADDGYAFAVGNDPARDFDTLIAATRLTDIPVIAQTRLVPENTPVPPTLAVNRARISFSDLRDLYGRASFVVVPLAPAVHASGVTSVLEGMAMGKAVIASDSEGIRDFVSHGETGLLVPPKDPAALARAMDDLRADPGRAGAMGRRGRSMAVERFGLRPFARRFSDLLLSISTDFRMRCSGRREIHRG